MKKNEKKDWTIPDFLQWLIVWAVIAAVCLPYPVAAADTAKSAIVIDGYYDDWKGFDQEKAFTWLSNNKECNHIGGIYMDEEYVYCHVKLNPLYLSQIPMSAFQFRVNGEKTVDFAAFYYTAKEDNAIDWSGNVYNLPVGTTSLGMFYNNYPKYYMGDLAVTIGTKQVTTANGQTIKNPVDELEFRISLKTLAQITNLPVESIKSISFSNPNLGRDSITTSGTSTGTFMGISMSVAVVIATMYFKKRKQVGQR